MKSYTHVWSPKAVADPGFPRGGGANPKVGVPTYYLANFSRKLHENEEILGQKGVHVSHAPSLRSATAKSMLNDKVNYHMKSKHGTKPILLVVGRSYQDVDSENALYWLWPK